MVNLKNSLWERKSLGLIHIHFAVLAFIFNHQQILTVLYLKIQNLNEAKVSSICTHHVHLLLADFQEVLYTTHWLNFSRVKDLRTTKEPVNDLFSQELSECISPIQLHSHFHFSSSKGRIYSYSFISHSENLHSSKIKAIHGIAEYFRIIVDKSCFFELWTKLRNRELYLEHGIFCTSVFF